MTKILNNCIKISVSVCARRYFFSIDIILNKGGVFVASKLAIFGGLPVVNSNENFESTWPVITDDDRCAVNQVFNDNNFNGIHNTEIEELESDYANYTGSRYALSCANGTAALHMAISAAGCGQNDEVIVPALTFVATAMAVLHSGAVPVFADIDFKTFNIDPEDVRRKITPKTRAVVAVDLHGLPADYIKLKEICTQNGLVLIADAAHSSGAELGNKKVGSLADINCTSLMPLKQFPTCGEGGLFSTDILEFRNNASKVMSFGEVILKNEVRAYNSLTLGWNYRMNAIQAAFARSQLKRLDYYADQFFKNGVFLINSIKEMQGIIVPYIPKNSTHTFHMLRLGFDPKLAGYDIDTGLFTQAVENAMRAEGLPLRHYQNRPLPLQTIFRDETYKPYGVLKDKNLSDRERKIEDEFPIAFKTIEHTRCIGENGTSGPKYFLNRNSVEKYVSGFYKIWENLDDIVKYTKDLNYVKPWIKPGFSTRGNWVEYN